MLKQKSKEWLKRYLPPEIIGTVTAMIGAGTANFLSNNLIVIAYAGAIGESIGFYSTILFQNIYIAHFKQQVKNKPFSFRAIGKIITNLFLEFGPPGLIDGLFIRPFLMYIFPLLLNNIMLGILVGKIAGDIVFYFLVIISYELIKYRQHRKENNVK